jgi:hypothetical protein
MTRMDTSKKGGMAENGRKSIRFPVLGIRRLEGDRHIFRFVVDPILFFEASRKMCQSPGVGHASAE